MGKKVIIAVGGTGGHIFPAMALAEQLTEIIPFRDVLFIGGGLEKNRYFDRRTFAYQSIVCGSFIRKDPWSIMRNVQGIGRGVWQSWRMIKDFKPNLAIGFGSYHSFPPLLAAKMASVPFILHAADCIPGKVIRFFSKHALITGIHFPQTAAFLKGKTMEVGMPLRKEYKYSTESKKNACEYFQLNPDRATILIFGGSQGAHAINQLFSEAILKSREVMQILHFTGDATMTDQLRGFYHQHGIKASVKDFEKNMHLAWQMADVVISRSGAGTIAEQLEFEVPGILIPYPHAADNHQEFNADFMVDTVGGGLKLVEKGLNAGILAGAIETIFAKKLDMQQAMRNYKKRARRRSLFELVEQALFKDL